MESSVFRNEIEAFYTDVEGMVTTVRSPQGRWTSGNHIVTTSEYYMMLAIKGESTLEDGKKFNLVMEGCWDIRDGKRMPGIFNRNDQRWDEQAHDDVHAAACCSYFYGREIAKAIYEHGNKWTAGLFKVKLPDKWKWIGGKSIYIPFACKWYFDNTESTPELEFKKWFGRFPWFVAGVKNAAGKNLNWFDRWMVRVYFKGGMDEPKDSTSGRKLRWLLMWPLYGKYEDCDKAMREWHEKNQELYPNGSSDFFGIYYGVDHPYSKLYKDPSLKAW